MTESPAPAPTGRRFVTVSLDQPIIRGEQKIDKINLRKPTAGDLRGVALSDVLRLDIIAISKVVPRISDPVIHAPDFLALDAEDATALAAEVSGFLLNRQQKAEAGLDQ